MIRCVLLSVLPRTDTVGQLTMLEGYKQSLLVSYLKLAGLATKNTKAPLDHCNLISV